MSHLSFLWSTNRYKLIIIDYILSSYFFRTNDLYFFPIIVKKSCTFNFFCRSLFLAKKVFTTMKFFDLNLNKFKFNVVLRFKNNLVNNFICVLYIL